MKNYVIYREDLDGNEIYIDKYQSLKSTLVETTKFVDEAKYFDTAREAYEWAGRHCLEQWHVGAR